MQKMHNCFNKCIRSEAFRILDESSLLIRSLMMNADITTRIEKDLIGHREINNDHYYGVQTLRALENFNLTNSKVGNFPNLIKALAMVKLACAEANYNLKT